MEQEKLKEKLLERVRFFLFYSHKKYPNNIHKIITQRGLYEEIYQRKLGNGRKVWLRKYKSKEHLLRMQRSDYQKYNHFWGRENVFPPELLKTRKHGTN